MYGTHSSGSAVAITEATAARVALLRTLELGSPANEVRAHNVVFAPDGQVFASAHTNGTVQLWRVADWSVLHTLNGRWPLAFAPDSQTVALPGAANTLELRRVRDGVTSATLQVDIAVLRAVAFSPDGQTLLLSGFRVSEGNVVELWRVADGTLLRTFEHAEFAVTSGADDIDFARDGHTIATAFDTRVGLWRAATGELVQTLREAALVKGVAFAPDGQTLAVTLREHVRLWRVADGQRLRGMDPGPVFVDEFMGTAWTPDGRLLASINTGAPELVLWRADTGKVVNPRATPTDLEGMLVSGLALAPDGTLIATSGGVASIRLWGVP